MPYPWAAGERITAAKLRKGIQAGVALMEFSVGSTSTTPTPYDAAVNMKAVTVTFAEPFDTVPIVVATPESGSPNVMLHCTVSGISTTGFTVTGLRTNTNDTNIQWIAMEA